MSFKLLASLVIVCTASVTLFGCSSTAHFAKAKDIELTKYKSYSWIEPEKNDSTGKPNKRNQIAEQNIHAAVDEALKSKGFSEVSSQPDLLVSADLLIEKNRKQLSDPVYSRPYTRSYLNPYTRRINTYYFPSRFMGYDNYSAVVKEGTITVNLVDAKTDKEVWQGWVTDEINDAHISEKEVDRNVKSIFKKLDTEK